MGALERYYSINAIQPFSRHNSAARGYMLFTHLSQSLVISNAQESIIQSGLENQIVNFLNIPKFKNKSEILDLIYSKNELKYIIYYDYKLNIADYVEVKNHNCLSNNNFGYFLEPNEEVMFNLSIGNVFEENTPIARTYACKDTYAFGTNANVLLLSLPGTVEDGVICSESFAKNTKFHLYENININVSSQYVFLNLYGDEDNYKILPEKGESVRDDLVVCAMRRIDSYKLSKRQLMEIDYETDIIYYAKNKSKIVNIDCFINNLNKLPNTSYDYLIKFINDKNNMNGKLMSWYGKNKTRYPKLSGKLSKLIRTAFLESSGKKYVMKSNSFTNIFLNIELEYETNLVRGCKISDKNGAKGIIIDIKPDNEMPYQIINGKKVIADIVMDPTSLIGRMNVGRLYEQYYTFISRALKYQMESAPESEYIKLADIYLNLIKITGKEIPNLSNQDKINLVKDCIDNEVFFYIPLSNEKSNIDIYKEMEDYYGKFINKSPIYLKVNEDMKEINTGYISPLYTIVLGKLPEFSACNTSNVNLYGFPTANKKYKFDKPYKNSPFKALSETETRLYGSYLGKEGLIEIKDRSSSPKTIKHMVNNILNANNPTNINVIVDRDKIPYGKDISTVIIKSLFNTMGIDYR